jgi:hypothetical protein
MILAIIAYYRVKGQLPSNFQPKKSAIACKIQVRACLNNPAQTI